MSKISQKKVTQFRDKIYDYYHDNKRLFPWRSTSDPYFILVSEVMLQQTQTERVRIKYIEFIRRFPTVFSLSNASLRDILTVWQGLGYNRRALYLKKTADIIVQKHRGIIPTSVDVLQQLPGIGYATACAICAFAFGKPVVFIETNIRTVYIHHFFSKRNHVKDEEIMQLVGQTLDIADPRSWYYSIMDYGAMLKKTNTNSSRKSAHHQKQKPFIGSIRQLRGLIVKTLLSAHQMDFVTISKTINIDEKKFKEIVLQLAKEELIQKNGNVYYIR